MPAHVEIIHDKSTVSFVDWLNTDKMYVPQVLSQNMESDNPLEIYIETTSCYYKSSECLHGKSFKWAKYTSKDGVFQNSIHIPPQLSFFDSTILGIRTLGYIITVPVDFALSFTPYKLFTGCAFIWGCP